MTNSSLRNRLCLGLIAVTLSPVVTEGALVTFAEGTLPSPGQSVNFAPANSGTTVVGDTNPAPVYDVFVQSMQSPALTLHGSGSTVDTGVGGAGFTDILLFPASPFAWTALDFKLDSSVAQPTVTSGTLTLTAFLYGGGKVSGTLDFPYTGSSGDNQDYVVTAAAGVFITGLEIQYNPKGGTGTTIQDIHNIDVVSATVPEPSAIGIWSFVAAVAGFGGLRNRLKRRKSAV